MLNKLHVSAGKRGAARSETRRPLLYPMLAFAWLLIFAGSSRAADPTAEVVTQPSGLSPLDTVSDFVKPAPRVQIFSQFHIGYDDNFQTANSGRGAWFTNEQLTLSYHLPSREMQLSLLAGVGLIDYLGERHDTTGFLDLAFARSFSRRLALSASISATYQAEPDFTENVGPNRFRGNYFAMRDNIALSYALGPRFSLVSSYGLQLVRYDNAATAAFADRESHLFGEQLRFSFTSKTVLTADYRLQLVDYVSAPFDSTTDFFLAGVEEQFSRNLSAQLRAGASVRFPEFGDTQTNPDFEWGLNYARGRDVLSWTARYSVEQSAERSIQDSVTFRTGVVYTRELTGRLSSSIAVYYHHDNNQQIIAPFMIGPTFDENTIDVTAHLRYRVNPRFSVDAATTHSQILSALTNREYSRNRYSIGMTYSF